LSLEEVLAIHERVTARFGGTGGVRDAGLLESALYRPQTGDYRDLAEMAAALFESLIMNHPFIDGNKRVAFFATDVFLRANGWRLAVDDDQANDFLRGLLDRGECDFAHLEPWLRKAMVEIGQLTE
jgi:death-on-curing protein